MQGCVRQPPLLLKQGIAEFNDALYFECHETLEELWLHEKAAVRGLYQGILQVGVALYKQRQGNFRGATNLLRRALIHLAPCAPTCQGVDVARLMEDADQVLSTLLDLGPERIAELDPALLPRVRWACDPETEIPGQIRHHP